MSGSAQEGLWPVEMSLDEWVRPGRALAGGNVSPEMWQTRDDRHSEIDPNEN
jgi:hypothetical protein